MREDEDLTRFFVLLQYTYTIGKGVIKLTIQGNYMHLHPKKQGSLINFKKVQSLMPKIIEMVQEDKYCIDIMQQNLSAIGLLKSAHQMLMEAYLNTCFKNAMAAKNEGKKQEMIKEILKVIKLFNK